MCCLLSMHQHTDVYTDTVCSNRWEQESLVGQNSNCTLHEAVGNPILLDYYTASAAFMLTSFLFVFFVVVCFWQLTWVVSWSKLSHNDHAAIETFDISPRGSFPTVETRPWRRPKGRNGSCKVIAPVFTSNSCSENAPLVTQICLHVLIVILISF